MDTNIAISREGAKVLNDSIGVTNLKYKSTNSMSL